MLTLIDFGGRVPLLLEFFGLGTNHHFPPDSEPACFPFEIRILPTQIQTRESRKHKNRRNVATGS